MDTQADTSFFVNSVGNRLAVTRLAGEGPVVLWLGGFLSDRHGTKAQALENAARTHGWAYLSFDYYAHGQSDGPWEKARMGQWISDAVEIVDAVTQGPVVGIGSSMGGWLLSALIKARPERVHAAGFIAPAPDFTHELMLPALDPESRHEYERNGYLTLKGYDRPVTLSRAFFDEAKSQSVLTGPIAFTGKVRLIHGLNDDVVPWQHGLRLLEAIDAPDIAMTLIKNGDHRLSRRQDISALVEMVADLRA
jgi:pimeloyl-ACP methyl ester carboxylesterase